MAVETLHFKVDPYWLINFMLQRHYEKNYDGNHQFSEAVRFALSNLLYRNEEDGGFTEEELYQIAEKYFGKDADEFLLDPTDEQAEAMFQFIFENPRYTERVWDYTLKGYGQYRFSVLDLRERKEYESNYANHYSTLVNILAENYADEFDKLSQEEKDTFILSNFKLIGKSRDIRWYTPQNPVSWHKEGGFRK